MSAEIKPGLIVLHGNQLEQLRAVVFEWLRAHPLKVLEPEIFLVQSNGVAEWLKISIAEQTGICAATRIELPGRFLWGVYRTMLGREQIPTSSALDQTDLTWRLMRLVPELLNVPDFAPLRQFLADGDPARRLQLAQKLAGLIDLYQLYRADWLDDWVKGQDQLKRAQGDAIPLPHDQRWQARLWRAILNDIPEPGRALGRIHIHQRFVQAIRDGATPVTALPRRVVLFGISAMPRQTLEALSALSAHTQVIVAVPNPCQYYWGDIIDGSQFFKSRLRRQQCKGGTDLSQCAPEQLHAHSHPLLANWGRQGRDFVRMLDDFDNAQLTRERFNNLRIDLFSEGAGQHLLERVQCAVRDLLPLAEHPPIAFDRTDRSIEFHVAHSIQREVEVLHDQLLAMLADLSQGRPLRPRDIIVMVPDIAAFSPAIRAVFGQYNQNDPRCIPYEIGDVNDRSSNPVLIAMEWLLRLPQQRCGQSELRDLLEVPAVAARFGLRQEDLAQLAQWIEGAGVRWGLDQAHRSGLGLAPAGEQNTWLFGVRRMLLGYASGSASTYAGVESYGEIGGLNAALAGSLAQFVESMIQWRAVLAKSLPPAEWGAQVRALIGAFFLDQNETDQCMLGRIEDALQHWLSACLDADFAEPVPLEVVRVAVMGAIDEPTLHSRFVSGGVTFCTLMPMRAVPFRVVCLLGMNDGDFPRRSQHVDFDLLALPGMQRPGDRSRRDDDRYLMLEALLSARERLYISWVGHNIKDNSEQPCSVLVSQLRDYLAAGWHCDLAAMTHQHPLQPFSRRYFENNGLLTYAKEWRSAHSQPLPDAGSEMLMPCALEPDFKLRLAELARFVKQPVKYFFRERLGVIFNDDTAAGEDEEPFGPNGLEEYGLVDSLLDDGGVTEPIEQVQSHLRQKAEKLGREGLLPIGLLGQKLQTRLVEELAPIRTEWLQLCAQYPLPGPKLPVLFTLDDIRLEDWLDGMQSDGRNAVWLDQTASKIATPKGELRAEKLVEAWLRQLVSAALGHTVTGYLVGRDAFVMLQALDGAESKATLIKLLQYWRAGRNRPLPTAFKTALALIRQENPDEVYNEGGFNNMPPPEVADLCLARLWPSYQELSAEADFEACSNDIYAPFNAWLLSKTSVQLIAAGVEDSQ